MSPINTILMGSKKLFSKSYYKTLNTVPLFLTCMQSDFCGSKQLSLSSCYIALITVICVQCKVITTNIIYPQKQQRNKILSKNLTSMSTQSNIRYFLLYIPKNK